MGNVVEFPRSIGSHSSKPLWRHALGEVLRRERLEQERILTEVAAAAGVSPQYLSEIERGRKEASSEILASVAEALGMELVHVVLRVSERLGARFHEQRRDEDRRDRIVLESSLALAADAMPERPSSRSGFDAADASVFLLAA